MRWIRIFLVAVLATFSGWSQALITVGSVSAGSNNVILSEGARTSVNWTLNFTATAGPAVLRSTQIVFRTLSGAVIGSQSRTISRAASVGGQYVLSESLYIPPAVANAAYRLGSSAVRVERVFTDSTDPGTPTGQVDLYLSTATASGLMVTRIDLRFNNDSRTTLVPRDSALIAIAQVRTEGNGWLEARWEIADGAGLQGTPLYRPLRAVRQFVGGGQILTLESPRLPTSGTGRYLVRLLVREPQAAAEAAPLLYQVMSQPQNDTLGLLSPPDAVLLQPTTRFAWLPVPGARAYVLELLPEEGPRAALDGQSSPQERRGAAMVPSTSTELELSALVRQGLDSGQRYSWRVIALDADGQVLTRSPLRRIQLP